ncbi:hypothetical protein [Streptomyces rhizosphaerihabitans]|uniref:hypothetical protein n=1 Tax=Streptomyces rhizosphaerihabitans TaxID=1266770 RepID=UPI0021BFD9D4|nr:hypothetical protein [Streptomyces rhizosphaerihabitans]MCT9008510.1 hypothetical protein [Streptomyces rhizosphaerihabitans]
MTGTRLTDPKAWLVLGGLHLLNGTAPLRDSDPVVLVPLAQPVETAMPSNTIVVAWNDLEGVELRARTVDGSRRHSVLADGAMLFPDMLPGTALRAAVTAVTDLPPGEQGPLVPLFYVSGDSAGLHVHSQVRFLAEDACFIRITPEPVAVGDDPEDLTWLAGAVNTHAEQFLFLNNHQRYYRKCFGGNELEYKYTLTGPVDSWGLTLELYRRVRGGELPGHVMEYRDEFQAWDYLNHLFEVTGPEAERGYVSFIPTTDGKHLVKRKWYAEDTFNRRETHTYGVRVEDDGGFERYIQEELKVQAVRMPSFRRVRYDINFESVRTGHVYGIFFDHCSLVDDRDVVLNQCELEYLRSRTAVEPDEAAALAEMDEIASWLEGFLREHGLDSTRGFYSKRTFLKDVVAARPSLSGVVG